MESHSFSPDYNRRGSCFTLDDNVKVTLNLNSHDGPQVQYQNIELFRRSKLYGSSSTKQFPKVNKLPFPGPTDTRIRLELVQLLNRQTINDHALAQNDCDIENTLLKHQEDKGYRPPLDQIQSMRDLHTTIPKNLSNHSNSTIPWRAGYQNATHVQWSVGENGVFEPRDSMRQIAVLNTSANSGRRKDYVSTHTINAYPPYVESSMKNNVSTKKLKEVDNKPRRRNRKPFIPAGTQSNQQEYKKKEKKQKYPIRESGQNRNSPEKNTNDRCLAPEQVMLKQVMDINNQLHHKQNQFKDPIRRYVHPIENTSFARSYRLGLEPVPSSFEEIPQESSLTKKISSRSNRAQCRGASMTSLQPLIFRPRTATFNRNKSDTDKSRPYYTRKSSLLHTMPTEGLVAGAKRRPHSASVCYLGNSTLYLMEAGGSSLEPSKEQANRTDYRSILSDERCKRSRTKESTLSRLAKKGIFSDIPIPQLYVRLRREAITNIVDPALRDKYERLSLINYMASCGLEAKHLDSFMVAAELTEDGVLKKGLASKCFANHTDHMQFMKETNQAAHELQRILFLTREQFQIVLQSYALAPVDVNSLYSALDTQVKDKVPVWEVLLVVLKLIQEPLA